MKSIENIKGFTAIELLLGLSIIGMLLFMSVSIAHKVSDEVNGDNMAKEAYQYSKSVERYITTHNSLLQELLSSNNGIVTIPEIVLKNEGFIDSGYPSANRLNQIPCAVITWRNNRLQSFLYYRSNGDSKTLNQYELNRGLQYPGAMIGIYKDGFVQGAVNLWSLDQTTTSLLFIQQGTVDPSQGVNPSLYQCGGTQLANNSYVIDIVITQLLNNKLPKDDTLHQYSDDGSALDDPQNSNTMLSDLNMDYKDPNRGDQKNNIIFQMNNECVMDPNDALTMQDYSPIQPIDPRISPNPHGCRNRQLSIEPSPDKNGLAVTITGFQQGGNDPIVQNRPYVGSVSALSVQPTAKVQVGTPCDATELGKMAQQQASSDPNDVNNLYISQVQCMKNPLCSTNNGTCYMPLGSISIQYKGILGDGQDFACPTGSAAIIPTDAFAPGAHPEIIWGPQGVPQPSNDAGPPASGCQWFSWDNVDHVRTTFNCDDQILPGFCRKFNITSKFNAYGPGQMGCASWGGSGGGHYIVTCTNDVSHVGVLVQE